MTSDEKVIVNATGAAIGAATGIAAGLAQRAAAPQLTSHITGAGAMNTSARFFHGTSKAFKHHKGIGAALGAGAVAAVPHGAIVAAAAMGTAAVAAAPFVLAAGAVGAGIWGIRKLLKS